MTLNRQGRQANRLLIFKRKYLAFCPPQGDTGVPPGEDIDEIPFNSSLFFKKT